MDISKIIEGDNSGLALTMLYKEDLVLTDYQKMLMVNHWHYVGRPESYEQLLILALGFEWDSYMNPYLQRIFRVSLDDLLLNYHEYESLGDPQYKTVLKMIFLKKLELLENTKAKHGYDSDVSARKWSDKRQSLILDISSKSTKYTLFYFAATMDGYKYEPTIRMFNSPDDQSHLFTEQSYTNLKAIIYYMSENETWDKSLMPRSLEVMRFKSPILNILASAIIEKHCTSDLLNAFNPPDEPEVNDEEAEEELY